MIKSLNYYDLHFWVGGKKHLPPRALAANISDALVRTEIMEGTLQIGQTRNRIWPSCMKDCDAGELCRAGVPKSRRINASGNGVVYERR